MLEHLLYFYPACDCHSSQSIRLRQDCQISATKTHITLIANMYLSATDIVKNALTSSTELSEEKLLLEDDHTYIRGSDEDRGPCPGLNALCNQNYL